MQIGYVAQRVRRNQPLQAHKGVMCVYTSIAIKLSRDRIFSLAPLCKLPKGPHWDLEVHIQSMPLTNSELIPYSSCYILHVVMPLRILFRILDTQPNVFATRPCILIPTDISSAKMTHFSMTSVRSSFFIAQDNRFHQSCPCYTNSQTANEHFQYRSKWLHHLSYPHNFQARVVI